MLFKAIRYLINCFMYGIENNNVALIPRLIPGLKLIEVYQTIKLKKESRT